MSPKDDKTDQAIGHLVREAFKSRLIIGLICLSVGGGSSTLMDKISPEKTDPRMDTLMVAVREFKTVQGQIKPLQDTVSHLGIRVAMIEDRDAREAYLAPRKRPLGRGWER